MSILLTVLIGAFALATIVAAFKDVVSLTIPNRLNLAIAALGAVALAVAGVPLETAGVHLAVATAVLVCGMGLFAMGWFGGGDVKLLAACALWLGWPATGSMLMWTAIGGGVFAIALISARRMAPAIAGYMPPWASRLLTGKGAVPYGVAIAFGVLMALPASPIFAALA